MKKIKLLFFILTTLSLANCAELSSALSSYNQTNGGQCATYTVQYYLYNPNTSKYEAGKIYARDKNGNDIKYKEKRWREGLGSSYLRRGTFTSYYKTSPYSGGEYKFVVHCTQWH